MTANPLSAIPPIGPTTGVTPPPSSSRLKPIDPLRVLREHLWLLIVAAVVGVLIGGGSWFVLRKKMPTYTSEARLLVQPPLSNPEDPVSAEAQQRYSDKAMESSIANEVVRLTSESVLLEAVARPEVKSLQWYQAFSTPREAREALDRGDLRVSAIRGTTLISVKAGTPYEGEGSKIAEAVINVYMNQLENEVSREDASLQRMYLDARERADQEIRRIQERIRRFLQDEELDSLESRSSAAAKQYDVLIQQQIELQSSLDAVTGMYQRLLNEQAAGTEPTPEQVATVEQMEDVVGIDRRRNAMKESLRAIETRYGPGHYQARATRNNLEALEVERQMLVERKMREYQSMQLMQASQGHQQLSTQLEALMPKVQEAAKRMIDLTGKLEQYQQLEEKLDDEQVKFRNADANLGRLRYKQEHPGAINVKRHMSATYGELTFPPDLKLYVPGVAMVIVTLTAGVIFLLEVLDQRLRSPADVKMVRDAELLGVLPDADEDPSGTRRIERIVETDPTGLIAEAVRQVRTAILAKMDRRGYKTLLVVGTQPGAGASNFTHNLATSVALNGRRVLIIDANLRRPDQHRLMDVNNGEGLVDVLAGKASVDQVIRVAHDIGLMLIPTGQSQDTPPEVFEGQAFRALLSQLETRFDLIIIDAPPALLTTDSQLLSKHMDAIAIIARASKDSRGMLERVLRQMDGQRADVLGVILNGVQSSAGGYFRKSYREFYRYRDNGGAGDRKSSRRLAVQEESEDEAVKQEV